MVRGVVVRGRLIDRANGRPVQAWVAYAALRDNPHLARLPGFGSRRESLPPESGMARAIDGRREFPAGRAAGARVPRRAHPVSVRRYIPAGVPPKERPGAPADALSVQYDTVPFELFPQNFPAVRPVDIAPGTESMTCDLTFDSGVVRTGTVLDPEGRPLAGASMIGETYRDTSRFDPAGGISIHGVRVECQSLADPDVDLPPRGTRPGQGGRRSTATIVARSRSGSSRRPRSRAASSTRRGSPPMGSSLRMFRLIDEPTRGAQQEFTPPIQATSDQDGRFRIDGIVPGVKQKLSARGFQGEAEGFILEDWTPRPGEVKDLGEVRPKADG